MEPNCAGLAAEHMHAVTQINRCIKPRAAHLEQQHAALHCSDAPKSCQSALAGTDVC
jgi:hypothetical protein